MSGKNFLIGSLLILALLLAACGGPAEPASVEAAPPEVVVDPDVPTEVPTREPVVGYPSPFEEEYRLILSYALSVANPEDDSTLLYTVSGGMSNRSGQEITIELESFFVIDEDGNRYYPEIPDHRSTTPLVGVAIRNNFSAQGSARFVVPTDIVLVGWGWCPDNSDCELPLTVAFP